MPSPAFIRATKISLKNDGAAGTLRGAIRIAASNPTGVARAAAPIQVRSASRVLPAPPVVQNISPAPGTAIFPGTPLTFDVVTSGDSFTLLQLIASFPGLSLLEVIYDYNNSQFGPQYRGPSNQVSVLDNGYHFSILRQNGWPASPTIIPYAVDAFGSENS